MKKVFFGLLLLSSLPSLAQTSYRDSIRTHVYKYTKNHGVVKGTDVAYMQFYEVNAAFRVHASVEKQPNSTWFEMPTSGPMKQWFRVYAVASFSLNGVTHKLNIYQGRDLMSNPSYANYLFIPFTDATTGTETYSGGRYIDLTTDDIQNGIVSIDFNKAYNPYCAYVSGKYNCPIPPKENNLQVAIQAGEKDYKKPH